MNNLNTLTIFTKALLDRGLDYEVTLKGVNVKVKLFDKLTGSLIGQSTQNSLESSLAHILAHIASGSPQSSIGLSRL